MGFGTYNLELGSRQLAETASSETTDDSRLAALVIVVARYKVLGDFVAGLWSMVFGQSR